MSAVPRNFKLLDELSKSEHGELDGHISYGLQNPDDMMLRDWYASILGPNGG
jgi:ubiquitin-conjugating enzyme E2 variant